MVDAIMEGNNSDWMPHPGSFSGHVIPGSMFILVALIYTIHVYHHYFTARKTNGKDN